MTATLAAALARWEQAEPERCHRTTDTDTEYKLTGAGGYHSWVRPTVPRDHIPIFEAVIEAIEAHGWSYETKATPHEGGYTYYASVHPPAASASFYMSDKDRLTPLLDAYLGRLAAEAAS